MAETTLREGLDAWGASPGARDEGHLTPAQLYDFALAVQRGESGGEAFDHIARCGGCLETLNDLLAGMEDAEERMRLWDIALPKAAATPVEEMRSIPTEGGRFTIEIRRHLTDAHKGIIAVQVSHQFRDTLEGRTVTLRDGAGKVLLQGRIINGEVSQEIDDLDTVDYGLMVQSA